MGDSEINQRPRLNAEWAAHGFSDDQLQSKTIISSYKEYCPPVKGIIGF